MQKKAYGPYDMGCTSEMKTEFTHEKVVYFNDPGEEEFFTRSRVNGRFLKNAKNGSLGSSDALRFESRFESGNLLRATRVADGEYELQLRNDLYTDRHTQWYNFQIKI